MPPFPRDAEVWSRIDYRLMQNGVVTLYWREALFNDTLAQLRALDYKVIVIDGRSVADTRSLLTSIGDALDFPAYYGRNLDALNDCMRDVAVFDYGSDARSEGTVIAFRRYDHVVRMAGDAAETVLDILTDRARDGLLVGHRMMVLVQSDDPNVTFGPLGAQHAGWNDREWLNSARLSGPDATGEG